MDTFIRLLLGVIVISGWAFGLFAATAGHPFFGIGFVLVSLVLLYAMVGAD